MATVRESRGAAGRSDGRTGTRMALVRRCRNGQTDGAESAVCAVLPTCDNRLTLTTPARRRALAARTILFGGRPGTSLAVPALYAHTRGTTSARGVHVDRVARRDFDHRCARRHRDSAVHEPAGQGV